MSQNRTAARIYYALALVVLALLAVISGELLWRAFLQDLFGMRPMAECVEQVYLRELKPQTAEIVRQYWLENGQPRSLVASAQEILSRAETALAGPEQIESLAISVANTTACHDADAARWQVATTVNEAVSRFTWDAIESIISSSNP